MERKKSLRRKITSHLGKVSSDLPADHEVFFYHWLLAKWLLAFLLKTDLFSGGSRIVWSALEPKLLWHNNQEFTLLKVEVPLYSKRLSWIYSFPNNGFKFHARRGWISVLRVLDCNEECWLFFLHRKSLNKYKFMKLWITFSEKNYVYRNIKHITWEISRPSPPSWKFYIHNASQSQCAHCTGLDVGERLLKH